jgi:excisionase family DNA binding protein
MPKTTAVAEKAPSRDPAALNLEQAAAYLGGLSQSYVRRLVAEKKLTARRAGKRLVFPVVYLDRFLADPEYLTTSEPEPRPRRRQRAKVAVSS